MRAFLRQAPTALRMLVVLSVVLGVVYPVVVTLVAQLPGLQSKANGSLVSRGGTVVGSTLIGQPFTDASGKPLLKYFQPRPSAGDYDPTATGASNLGPESIVDAGPDGPSLLTQVCQRSAAIGETYGVDGSRPYCADGAGAVLAVFYAESGYRGVVTRVVAVDQFCPTRPFLATYLGVTVQCARPGADYAAGKIVAIRGSAPANPAVPADAVTASGSGLDPNISPAYAKLQETVVARERGMTVAQVDALVQKYTDGRDLGFLGEARVNVLLLNLALDRSHPA